MTKITVGVLRGGPSNEYEVSLKTGASVLKHLPTKYNIKDIFISKDGEWHIDGIVKTPEKILKTIDVVFNAMHGEYGEDGKVQKLLDDFGIPYTGSGALASALGMNKVLSKKAFLKHKIKTPLHLVLRKGEDTDDKLKEIFRTFPHPCVVKPSTTGSSVGVTIAKNFKELKSGVKEAFKYADAVLIEEFIRGREATCGVVDDFRDKKHYSLFPVEIIKPDSSEFFDYKAKYSGETKEICPANFPKDIKDEIQKMAVSAHKALDLRHYSRSDFIINPKRGIYILEVNTLPGLTSESLMPKSLRAIGCELTDFLDHLIKLALGDKK